MSPRTKLTWQSALSWADAFAGRVSRAIEVTRRRDSRYALVRLKVVNVHVFDPEVSAHLSMATILYSPDRMQHSATCEPMYPAPPVIRIVLRFALIDVSTAGKRARRAAPAHSNRPSESGRRGGARARKQRERPARIYHTPIRAHSPFQNLPSC